MKVTDYFLQFEQELNSVEFLSIVRQFKNNGKNCDKVNFIAGIMEKHIVLSDYNAFIEKNNQKSAEYRKLGNTYFSLTHKDYVRALEYYNQAICYAELNTECLAIGYANRSAIYYEWKLFDECLKNIELAFEASTALSDKLCVKIQNRKKMCLDNIGNKPVEIGASRPFELSYPAHSRVPFVVESLIMEQNDQFGRLIKTTQDLYPGDCIIIEQPSAAVLQLSQMYKRCAQCMIENNYNLIPCQHCTTTMYCSIECRDAAFTSYHRFECSAINGLITLLSIFELTALNVVLKLFSNVAYLDKTIDYLNNFSKIDSFNFDYKSKYDYADEYKMIHNMETHESKYNIVEKVRYAFVTAVIYKLLKSNIYLEEIFAKSTPERQYKDLFLSLLYINIYSSHFNLFGLGTDTRFLVDFYGVGVYPFSSLINHSCKPNVSRFVHDQTLDQIFIVIGNIAKGEQIFMNYGYNFAQQPKQVRQEKLLLQHFKCVCEACELDYPMLYDMKPLPNVPHIITKNVLIELSKFDRSYAKKLKLIISNYLKKYDKYLPASQIHDAWETLQLCILIILQQIPLHITHKK